jgi:hypothetical protein
MKKHYGLQIKFPDTSPSFAHGVEYGRLLQKMEDGNENVENNGFPVRIENMEILKKTCEVYGYIPVFGQVYWDEWVELICIKKTTSNN